MNLKYPRWFYGGPYSQVADPDRDLPIRPDSPPITTTWINLTERNGIYEGQRIISPFNDSNSVDDILGDLSLVSSYPDGWDDSEKRQYPTIQGQLHIVVLRLEDKLRPTRSESRTSCFTRALECVQEAIQAFYNRQYSRGQELALKAESLILDGNNARSRRTPPIELPYTPDPG